MSDGLEYLNKCAVVFADGTNETCGGIFNFTETSAQEYEIASPNYPYDYPNNIRCEWTFNHDRVESSEVFHYFLVTFPDIVDLQKGNGCQFDSLRVRTSFIR